MSEPGRQRADRFSGMSLVLSALTFLPSCSREAPDPQVEYGKLTAEERIANAAVVVASCPRLETDFKLALSAISRASGLESVAALAVPYVASVAQLRNYHYWHDSEQRGLIRDPERFCSISSPQVQDWFQKLPEKDLREVLNALRQMDAVIIDLISAGGTGNWFDSKVLGLQCFMHTIGAGF